MVYESTAECFVPENALAGAVPTEIGQLAQLVRLDLSYNQLTGASKKLTSLQFWYTSLPLMVLCPKMRWQAPSRPRLGG